MRILVVQRTPAVLREWTRRLRAYGLAVDGARTGTGAMVMVDEHAYDAVVLAQDLADGDGFDLVPSLGGEVAVVGVTDEDAGHRRSALIAQGADDCITPPFDVDELCLRVCRALVRRTEGAPGGVVVLGRVVVERVTRRVTLDGRELDLTPTEMCVLDHLVAHRHRLVTTEELFAHCWDAGAGIFSNPVPSQIRRLRQKLAAGLLITWSGQRGYLLEAPATEAPAPEEAGDGAPGSDLRV